MNEITIRRLGGDFTIDKVNHQSFHVLNVHVSELHIKSLFALTSDLSKNPIMIMYCIKLNTVRSLHTH